MLEYVGSTIAGIVTLGLLCTVVVTAADGQVNIERLRRFDDGVHFRLGADFAFSSGNSDFIQFGTSGRFDYLDKKVHLFTIGSILYGETNNVAYKNRAFVHQRFNYAFSESVIGELFGQVEEDEFVLLQLRVLGGAGGRFRLIDDEEYSVFVGVGAMLEHEVLDESRLVNHAAVTTSIRATNYLSLRIRVSDGMDIVNIVYFQPRFDDINDSRILSDGSLVFKVSEQVSWSNSVLIRHDGIPPASLESTDISLRSGISVQI